MQQAARCRLLPALLLQPMDSPKEDSQSHPRALLAFVPSGEDAGDRSLRKATSRTCNVRWALLQA